MRKRQFDSKVGLNSKRIRFFNRSVLLYLLLFFAALHTSNTLVYSQTLAILNPEKTSQSTEFALKLSNLLDQKATVIDASLADTVLKSKEFSNPFNLSVEEAKNLGSSIGSHFFILIKTHTQRRSSFERNEYYEAYLAVYLVSSLTGKLASWKFVKFEEDTFETSKMRLREALPGVASEIADAIKNARGSAIDIDHLNRASLPAETKNSKPPLPYKRLSPKYTDLADLYDIEATVDIEVAVDKEGKISHAEIVRWAGYGLDESVIKTVKEMQWRPAERNGKPFPMRILLRYNFKNIKTE